MKSLSVMNLLMNTIDTPTERVGNYFFGVVTRSHASILLPNMLLNVQYLTKADIVIALRRKTAGRMNKESDCRRDVVSSK